MGLRAVFLILAGALGIPAGSAQMTAVIDTSAYRPGTVEGVITSALTGKPLDGVSISVTGTTLSTVTGAAGGFRLRNVPPGTHTVVVVAEGMRSVSVEEIAVRPAQTVRLRSVELRPLPRNGVEELGMLYVNASQVGTSGDFAISLVPLAQLVVVPSHYAAIEESVAAKSSRRRGDLESEPLTGEDPFRAIARLPGLATTDTATRFWVRGAPNDQVLTRFDGLDLGEPFHLKGFDGSLSVVDLETVGQLDLTTGGFTAKYGNRMAAVLTMDSESYDAARAHTLLGASLTGARVVNRGEFAQEKGNWLVEGRLGCPGAIVGNLMRDDGELETTYSDFSGKIEYRPGPDETLSLHFLQTRDTLDFKNADTPYRKSNYGADYLWGRWQGQIGERLFGETVLSLDYLSWRHRETGIIGETYTVSLKDYRDLTAVGLRQDWTLLFSDKALLQSGFEYTSGRSNYSYRVERYRVLLFPPFRTVL